MRVKLVKSLLIVIFILISSSCTQKLSLLNESEQISFPESLGIVLKEDWGWKDAELQSPVHTPQYITIHHGGVDFEEGKDVAQHLKNLQDWSRREKKWIDIPYHFMIDLEGKIYETRPINFPGDTNTDYDPTGHALICLMGNYENQTVSEDQLNSIVNLTAFLADKYGISTDKIKGHMDYAETACPGKDLYRYISDGTITKRVKEIIN